MTLIELIIFASVGSIIGSIIGGIIFGSAINGAWFGIAFITIYYSRFLRRSSNPYYWLKAYLNKRGKTFLLMKKFLLISLYLGGAGVLLCAFFLIGIGNLHKLLAPSDEEFSKDQLKKSLVIGIKECIVREIENETTKFSDVKTFSSESSYGYGDSKFKIQAVDPNSCLKARAIPENKKETWFQIEVDTKTGKVSKTCGDSSKIGCEEGNSW
tara:strand:- start:86 stop:721 length:636 start_codon:yes stop_codon:yes gene_type:complete